MTLSGLAQIILPYIDEIVCAFAFSVWEYWLGRTKLTPANSSLGLVGLLVNTAVQLFKERLKKGMKKMENQVSAPEAAVPAAASEVAVPVQPDKEVKLGDVGELELDFHKGMVTIAISAKVPGEVGVEGGAFVKMDSEKMIKKLLEAIQKKLPAGAAPVADTVGGLLIAALKQMD